MTITSDNGLSVTELVALGGTTFADPWGRVPDMGADNDPAYEHDLLELGPTVAYFQHCTDTLVRLFGRD